MSPFNERVAFKGPRDRSYSEGHALRSSHSDGMMGDTDTNKSDITSKPKTAYAKTLKHRHGHRPRSKSLDHHRHSNTPVRRKKHSQPHRQHFRHVPRGHSPTGIMGHPHHYSHHHDPASPRFEGNMWVRPVAAKRRAAPVFPVLASGDGAAERRQPRPSWQTYEEGGLDNPSWLDDYPLARQATASSLPGPSSFDDDITTLHGSPDSSFGAYRRSGTGPTRVAFGIIGRPLGPRPAL